MLRPIARDSVITVPSSSTSTGTRCSGFNAVNSAVLCCSEARSIFSTGIDMPFSERKMRTRRGLGARPPSYSFMREPPETTLRLAANPALTKSFRAPLRFMMHKRRATFSHRTLSHDRDDERRARHFDAGREGRRGAAARRDQARALGARQAHLHQRHAGLRLRAVAPIRAEPAVRLDGDPAV